MRRVIVLSLVLFSAFTGGAFAQNKSSDFSTEKSVSYSKAGIELIQSNTNDSGPSYLASNLEELRRNFNKNASSFRLPSEYRLNEYEFEEGEVTNSASFSINENMHVFIFLSKESEAVTQFYLGMDPQNSDESAFAILTMAALIQTLNPDLEREEIGPIPLELVNRAKESRSYVIDGIKYTLTAGAGIGWWLLVEPAST